MSESDVDICKNLCCRKIMTLGRRPMVHRSKGVRTSKNAACLLDYSSSCVEIPPLPRNSVVNTKAAVGYCTKAIPLDS